MNSHVGYPIERLLKKISYSIAVCAVMQTNLSCPAIAARTPPATSSTSFHLNSRQDKNQNPSPHDSSTEDGSEFGRPFDNSSGGWVPTGDWTLDIQLDYMSPTDCGIVHEPINLHSNIRFSPDQDPRDTANGRAWFSGDLNYVMRPHTSEPMTANGTPIPPDRQCLFKEYGPAEGLCKVGSGWYNNGHLLLSLSCPSFLGKPSGEILVYSQRVPSISQGANEPFSEQNYPLTKISNDELVIAAHEEGDIMKGPVSGHLFRAGSVGSTARPLNPRPHLPWPWALLALILSALMLAGSSLKFDWSADDAFPSLGSLMGAMESLKGAGMDGLANFGKSAGFFGAAVLEVHEIGEIYKTGMESGEKGALTATKIGISFMMDIVGFVAGAQIMDFTLIGVAGGLAEGNPAVAAMAVTGGAIASVMVGKGLSLLKRVATKFAESLFAG
jgi:hypothetical protein